MKKIMWVERNELFSEAKKKISNVNSVLDVGCGIRPQTLTNTLLHICVDAHQQYLEVLKNRISVTHGIKGSFKYKFINKTVDNIISDFPKKSVDTIFLLDVIEHLEKPKGLELIAAFNNIACHQIVIFTPLGFISQEHPDGKDAWGLDGGKWQEHKSGWYPEDFDDEWEFIICKDFHSADNLGFKHESQVGAFFAIKTLDRPPYLLFKKNIFAKFFYWLKHIRTYKNFEEKTLI
jgi:hypothetical protein